MLSLTHSVSLFSQMSMQHRSHYTVHGAVSTHEGFLCWQRCLMYAAVLYAAVVPISIFSSADLFLLHHFMPFILNGYKEIDTKLVDMLSRV